MNFNNSNRKNNVPSSFGRSQSLSSSTTSAFGGAKSKTSYQSMTKSSTYQYSFSSSSSSVKHEESGIEKNFLNRSSINKPEFTSLHKDSLMHNVNFTSTEKEPLREKRPYRSTSNAPMGTYTTVPALRKTTSPNMSSITGVTFSGQSSLSMLKEMPPPIPVVPAPDAVRVTNNAKASSPTKKVTAPLLFSTSLITNNSKNTPQSVSSATPAKRSNVYEVKGKKGFGYIFNSEKFDEGGGSKSERVGSRYDEKELHKTLGRFNIEMKVERDPSLATIDKRVKEISKMDFRKKSCLFVCILSHGNEAQTIFAKDKSYNLDKDIIEPIIRNATLVGKPKIFIIQACKGGRRSVGYTAMTDATPYTGQGPTKPTESDILILYSSYEGRVSYRLELGSIFIQKLCTYINSHHASHNLEEIMKETRRDIIDNSDQSMKQTPTMVSTLTKDFYFTV